MEPTINTHRNRSVLSSVAVLSLAATITGCGVGTSDIEGDGPVYNSVADITAHADVVVHGVIGTIRGTELDDGGNDADGGVPMAFYNVAVDELLSGTERATTVVVGWIDTAATNSEISELETGDEVVLFLEHLTTKDAPGIDTETDFYVPVGGEHAVFDVNGLNVTARSPNMTSLEQGASPRAEGVSDRSLTVSLVELAAVVATHST